MTDEATGQKTKKLGKGSIAKLGKNKAWIDFMKKSEIASKANTEHEEAKEAMRVYLKQVLGLDADAVIDFSKNSADNTITIVERLERKPKRTAGGDLLDDKF
jgi:hypothetical protein